MQNTQALAILQAGLFALGPIVEEQSETITERLAMSLVDQVNDTENPFDNVALDGLCGLFNQFTRNVEEAKASYPARKAIRDAETLAGTSPVESASGVADVS